MGPRDRRCTTSVRPGMRCGRCQRPTDGASPKRPPCTPCCTSTWRLSWPRHGRRAETAPVTPRSWRRSSADISTAAFSPDQASRACDARPAASSGSSRSHARDDCAPPAGPRGLRTPPRIWWTMCSPRQPIGSGCFLFPGRHGCSSPSTGSCSPACCGTSCALSSPGSAAGGDSPASSTATAVRSRSCSASAVPSTPIRIFTR